MKAILIGLVKFYRSFISPMMAPHCRFYPTCSCYAQESLQRHGALKGSYLALHRLSKCHPWHDGGVDLVPDVFNFKDDFSFKNK